MPTHLRCSNPQCSELLDRNFSGYACPRSNDLLDVVIDPPQLKPAELKARWLQRRASSDLLDRSGVWRFRDFLPEYATGEVISICEGNTPVIPGQKALEFGGVAEIGFKHLGWNPTGCFKDLGMTVAITEARRRGKNTVACASTGNTAASIAAYAARAGMKACVYLPKGKVSLNKLAQSIDYGAEIIEIDG
ncbi:MAG: pyridoxal-phosphate dependent enzyme, partial [Candidatus Korobacteraceae bacterium]